MFLCIAVLYSLYFLGDSGLLPLQVFLVAGVPVFIRAFNRLHEAVHAAPGTRNPFAFARYFPILVSPFQLSYASIQKDHFHHHAHVGTEKDPTAWLTECRSPVTGFLLSLVEAEVAWLYHLRRHGASRDFVLDTLRHLVMTGVLVALTGRYAVYWFALTRLGNTLAWYVFDYWLHQPRFYGRGVYLPLRGAVRLVWGALFSFDNVHAVEHHHLHHRYAFVPAGKLPALAAFLQRQT
jgi:fatty acid desaturase